MTPGPTKPKPRQDKIITKTSFSLRTCYETKNNLAQYRKAIFKKIKLKQTTAANNKK